MLLRALPLTVLFRARPLTVLLRALPVTVLLRALPLTVAVAAPLLGTGVGHAQLLGTGGGADNGTQVEIEQVISTVDSAFLATVEEKLAEKSSRLLDAASRSSFTELGNELRPALLSKVRAQLEDLRGDGILESREVSRELGPLWDRTMEDLDQAILALRQGYPIPPLSQAYDTEAEYMRAALRYTFLVRNEWHNWLRLIGSVLAALLLAWAAHFLVGKLGDRLDQRNLKWSAEVMRSMGGPLYATALFLGLYLGLSSVWLPGLAVIAVPRTLMLGLTFSLFWLAWRLCGPIAAGIGYFFNHSYPVDVDRHVLVVIARVLRLMVFAIFVVFIAQRILNSNVTGVVTSLGVVGLVLALALRGTVRNIFASLTLFADKPFRIGEMVIFEDDWGRIEDVGVRSTKFRSLDGHLVSIPNHELLDDAIHNISARPFIRRRFRLSLVYDTPPDKVSEAIDIVKDILSGYEQSPEDYPPRVLFESYGDYDLQILVQYWYAPPDYWASQEFDSQVNLQILERFNAASIEFAFPTETSIFKEYEGPAGDQSTEHEDDDAEPMGDRSSERTATQHRGEDSAENVAEDADLTGDHADQGDGSRARRTDRSDDPDVDDPDDSQPSSVAESVDVRGSGPPIPGRQASVDRKARQRLEEPGGGSL